MYSLNIKLTLLISLLIRGCRFIPIAGWLALAPQLGLLLEEYSHFYYVLFCLRSAGLLLVRGFAANLAFFLTNFACCVAATLKLLLIDINQEYP